jgi:GNAT superfamily N-acetyltransferase
MNGHTPIAIRRAGGPDARTIARHRVGMFRDMGSLAAADEADLLEAVTAFLGPALEDGRYSAWLATPLDRPSEVIAGAGVLLWRTLPRPLPGGGLTEGWQALVMNVYTEPAWRRQGIAERLMRALLAWTREQGIATVVLHASNEGRPLYERLGFTPTNEMRLIQRVGPPSVPFPPPARSAAADEAPLNR